MFVSFCIVTNAQEDIQERITTSPQPVSKSVLSDGVKIEKSVNKSTTISVRAGESQVTHDNAYFLNEIAKIDNQISAINQKINQVNSDSTEADRAEDAGWFDDMENIKAQLEAKKVNLQNQLN